MDFKSRLSRLRPMLAAKEIDAIFVSQPENRQYLSGFNGSAGYLLIDGQSAVLATDFRYIEQARAQAPDYEVFRISGDIAEWFPRLVADFRPGKLGFEAGDVTFALYQQLTDALDKTGTQVKLAPVTGVVENLRSVKEPEEVEFITRAVEITDAAFEYVESIIHAGVTEKEIAWEIERFLRERGSQPVPFDLIVASGPNAALPHARPSSRAISPGEPVIFDIGARISGYTSDLSRTFCLGKPDGTLRKVYDIVLGAQLATLAIIKEGMSGSEADSLARTIIAEAGYAEAFGHGLGHGVGLAIHESPRLGPNSADKLASGMVFTVEPGIYLTGWGGVRIEDVAIMENGKARVISRARKVLS